jgi:hypothetical protein
MANKGSVKKSGAPGEPHILAEIPQDAIQRFNSKLIEQPNGCVYYSGAVQNQGYCNFYYRRESDGRIRYVTAHKFSAMISGKFTEQQINEYCVLHDCDQNYDTDDTSYRQCVNPDHLWSGTVKDNIQDCINKGRYKKPPVMRGEDNANSTITEAQARFIIDNHYVISQSKLAKIVGCCVSTVQQIHMNRSWKHLAR